MHSSSFYRLPNGIKIELDKNKMTLAAENTKQYDNDYAYHTNRQQRSYEQPAEILVVDGDCLDAVLCFKEKYSNCNPVVLNMANANSPGGGWRNGLHFIFELSKFIFILFRLWSSRRKSSSSFKFISMS